ncbi:phosphatidate cytidylyltransferase [candidate division TA06 bacterium]|uniref:Phosphatidate cytidylyltransferase n=1 Tax=candidate division TA06 bacterium TaxID=2250710 RepID=A0A523XSL5_UNCT6|nr:MAG: phosphatidate cytidylyltransferase [candidate division TA06 bacterium]
MRVNLLRRLVTALVFLPVLVIVARAGGGYYLVLIGLGIGIGTYEFLTMLEARGMKPYKVLGTLCALLLGWSAFYQSYLFTYLTFTILLLALSITELSRRTEEQAINHIATTIFGAMYVGWLMSHLVLLRELPYAMGQTYSTGTGYALLPFVLTWSCDSAAYFFGIKFGRHKLLPRISPEKSWEGAIGGVFFAVIAGFVYQQVYAHFLSWFDILVLGFFVGVLAQVGDLVESLIKRDADMKDAATTIPGHGGVLDRFDSLRFTAPMIYYYLRFFAAR